jgi:hypothetical protein
MADAGMGRLGHERIAHRAALAAAGHGGGLICTRFSLPDIQVFHMGEWHFGNIVMQGFEAV